MQKPKYYPVPRKAAPLVRRPAQPTTTVVTRNGRVEITLKFVLDLRAAAQQLQAKINKEA